MKENRYFQMVYLLLEKGSMTAPELADYFEVSVRTIYRDCLLYTSSRGTQLENTGRCKETGGWTI